MFFRASEKDRENDALLDTPPPTKRILRVRSVSNRKGRRRVSEGSRGGSAAGGSRRKRGLYYTHTGAVDGSGMEDENSAVTLDGPVSGFVYGSPSTESRDRVSTPPVARIIPSSFFSQLVGTEPRPIRTPKPRVFTDSEESQWLVVEKREKVDYRGFRLDPESVGRKGSVGWKRMITPPKISVRDLISRFRQEDEEDEDSVRMVEVATQTERYPSKRAPAASRGEENAPRVGVSPKLGVNSHSPYLNSSSTTIGPPTIYSPIYSTGGHVVKAVVMKEDSNSGFGELVLSGLDSGISASSVVCLTSPYSASVATSQNPNGLSKGKATSGLVMVFLEPV